LQGWVRQVMKPFWARLVFLGFMALASAISFNALYMQGKRPPPQAMAAARKEAASLDKPAQQKAVAEPNQALPGGTPATAALGVGTAAQVAANVPLPEARAATEVAPPKVVQAVMRELKLHGYRPGTGPGLDHVTRAAIISFEFDQGMPLTGEPSEALLKSILFAQSKRQRARAPAEKFEKNQELVRQIQAILASLGFSSATADGTMSQATREAIKRFEASRKLPESGKLGERLLIEIIAVSGRPIAAAS
jgi:hypothetical protein